MIGPWQIAIIVLLVVVFFGRGKISGLMGDVGKGITSFRKGLKEGNEPEVAPKAVADNNIVEGESTPVAEASKEKADS
ncbi:MAG: twin-arginine translocase TatA/TatE family subunit [Kordiimonadaceae bacterium]|nr:twin-arginine translocase TatA/TatE family subunit [Kordiimonadaceae bacterium]